MTQTSMDTTEIHLGKEVVNTPVTIEQKGIKMEVQQIPDRVLL